MYELTSVELWRLIIAMFLGGVVIGYLLTSWHQDVLLDRAEIRLADDAHHIEYLVDCNDVLSTENQELRSTVRQYEATFGKEAIASTSYDF